MLQADYSLLEEYTHENLQLLEQLESLLLAAEKLDQFTNEQVDSIFRILHTVKGSSAMMEFDGLAKLSHALEDLFGFIRDHNDHSFYDHCKVCDLVFSAQDLLKSEIEKLRTGEMPTDTSALLEDIQVYYNQLKRGSEAGQDAQPTAKTPDPVAHADADTHTGAGKFFYKAIVFFEKDCKTKNICAFGIVRSVEKLCVRIVTIPQDVRNDQNDDLSNGFTLFMQSNASAEQLQARIAANPFIIKLEFEQLFHISHTPLDRRTRESPRQHQDAQAAAQQQQPQNHTYISVRLDKLDKLMDLICEIATAETMVIENPDLAGLQSENFSDAAQQLRKLTAELQDTVLSIRMTPALAAFHKLERIVRDICKKTNKQAELVIIGEDIEMDKNVIDNLSDPLMHIIRNAMDHGIEMPDEREEKGKHAVGMITLEAKNAGSDVMITISDDGRGLDRDVLVQKGIDRGLIQKPVSEVTDKEAYELIFQPGFSTKEAVTEFSGRGVGLDIATKSIAKLGGSISVDSSFGSGMTVQLRIPLTLAIMDGMQITVGNSIFIVPLLNIRETFQPKKNDVFFDPAGNEMIKIGKNRLPVVRLHSLLGLEPDAVDFEDGILVHIESDRHSYCLFADKLIGERQIAIKPIPPHISGFDKWARRIAGCTILEDGSISLILDINHVSE